MLDVSYIKYNTPTAVAIFLLSPLFALPYLLMGIYQREKSAFLLFSLLLGLLAWLQIPFADLYRHTMNAYRYYYEKPISSTFDDTLSSDFAIPLISWFIVNHHLPYQILRLFYISESFFLLTVIFNYMVDSSEREYTRGEVFLRFCILYLFFEFIRTTSGVRYGFALYQYIYALHLFFNRRQYLLSALFAFLAMEIHTSFVYFIPISLLLYLVCRSRKTAFLVFIIASSIVSIIVSKYSYLLGIRADWYFSGGEGVSGNSIRSITTYGFILFVFVRVFLFPFVYLSLRYFSSSLKWSRMATIWIMLLCIFITNITMLNRFAFIIAGMGVFILLDIENKMEIRKSLVSIIMWCGITTTFFNTVNYRKYIVNSRYQYVALPVFVILQNQYDNAWIMEHVDGNKIKKRLLKMTKVAILYICTGRYNQFFVGFYKSCEKYFMKGIAEVEYFVFTDDMGLSQAGNVHLIKKQCEGFPKDSLFRFEMFMQVREQLIGFDYIYFLNSNAEFRDYVGKEILPVGNGLVAALWIARKKQPAWMLPYERNKKSMAYIAPFQPPYMYYMGGINGGTAEAYMEMIETLAKNIRKDYENGIIAIVHDESHINKYLRTHECKILPDEYCYPEEWVKDGFNPKIVFRDKVRLDPYFNKGREHSLKGKVKKGIDILWRAVTWYL